MLKHFLSLGMVSPVSFLWAGSAAPKNPFSCVWSCQPSGREDRWAWEQSHINPQQSLRHPQEVFWDVQGGVNHKCCLWSSGEFSWRFPVPECCSAGKFKAISLPELKHSAEMDGIMVCTYISSTTGQKRNYPGWLFHPWVAISFWVNCQCLRHSLQRSFSSVSNAIWRENRWVSSISDELIQCKDGNEKWQSWCSKIIPQLC